MSMDYKDKYIQLLEELLEVYKDKSYRLEKELSTFKQVVNPSFKSDIAYYLDNYKTCTCPKGNCCTDSTCSYREFGEPKGY